MLTIMPVTPESRQLIDPTGKVRRSLNGLTNECYNDPSCFIVDHEKAWSDYISHMDGILLSEAEKDYTNYNTEMLSKCSRQGGRISKSKLETIIEGYYHDINEFELHPDIEKALQYLIARIQFYVQRDGAPQLMPYAVIRGTAAGLPTASKKGSFDAETVENKPTGHILPAYPWFRRMRGKDRSIFVDATVNVHKTAPTLTAAREWLKSHFPEYFAAWLNPNISVRPLITLALDRQFTSVEEDYKSMDMGFTFPVVRHIILPIYRAIFGPNNLLFEAHIEELFSQPLYWGDTMWLGEHALFSGQNPTNDFETLFTIVLQIAVALRSGADMMHLALGDDATMFVKPAYAHQVHKLFVEYATSCGMFVHDDGVKNRIASRNSRFCRKCYASTGKRDVFGNLYGAYPTSLVINAIMRPEKIASTKAQAVAADLQRLDNVYYQKDWMLTARWIKKWYTGDLTKPANELASDWWERLYGERWTPTSSPAFCYFNGQPEPRISYDPLDVYSSLTNLLR